METRIQSVIGPTALIVALAAVVAGCDIVVGGLNARETAKDQWTRSYQLAAGGRVEIVNANGKIDVEATDAATVEIRGERSAGAPTREDAEALLRQLEIREQADAQTVKVEVTSPRSHGSHTKVDFWVKVPKDTDVRLHSLNGSIVVAGVAGSVSAETNNGGITLERVAGTVDATTTNGSVRVLVTDVTQDGIRLETTNGSIELQLPGTARADIDARTVNGGIGTTNLQVDEIEKSRRRLKARLNGGGGRVNLETSNGSIRIVGQ